MKRTRLLSGLAAVLLGGCLWGGKKLTPFLPEERRLGIVMPFSYTASDKAYAALAGPLGDALTTALIETKRLRMIDKARLESTLAELKLPAGVPLDSAQIATVCKALKAEVAAYGAVVAVQKEQQKKGGKVSESLAVTVEAKLVQASTAEILSNGRATGNAAVKYREGNAPPAEILTNAALSDAANQIAAQLVTELLPK